MVSKKNNYIKYILGLLILASCSTTSEDLMHSKVESNQNYHQRVIHNINAYNSFHVDDLEIIQQKIDNQKLSQGEFRDLILLKKNYQKILKKNKYYSLAE